MKKLHTANLKTPMSEKISLEVYYLKSGKAVTSRALYALYSLCQNNFQDCNWIGIKIKIMKVFEYTLNVEVIKTCKGGN